MARHIITTQTTQHGTGPTLAIYREEGTYRVGLLSDGWQFTPLPEASFWTYTSAHERWVQEGHKRQ